MANNPNLNAEQQTVMDGLAVSLERAAELGLIPTSGAKISRRGEFIVNPSNIEEDEDKRQRRYRYKPWPKHVHGWDAAGEPVSKEVADQAAFDAALADGWCEDNDPKRKPKAVAKAASEASHRVVDAVSGRTALVTSHPEDVNAPTPVKAKKAKKK